MPDPVSLSDVKKLLNDEAAVRPLPREAMLAQHHAEAFARLEPDQTKKLVAELRDPAVRRRRARGEARRHPPPVTRRRCASSSRRNAWCSTKRQLTRLLETIARYR